MTEFLHPFRCGHTARCEYIKPESTKNQSFTLVYAHGFCSDPYGRKPEEIKKWCVENGMGFFRYEIAGHGADKGRFEETTINTYKSQIFEIVDEMVDGDVVTAGASLGGWLGLLAAVQFPDRVRGFLGLAAAPDFLRKYFEAYFRPEHKEILERTGKITFSTDDFIYVITKEMIKSGNDNLLLEADTIHYSGKVRLLQGMKDASLDWRTAPLIAQKLTGDDVKVVLLKNSNHRLGKDGDIAEIRRMLADFLPGE